MKRFLPILLSIGLAFAPAANAVSPQPQVHWDRYMNLPSQAEIRNFTVSQRSPYIACYLEMGGSGRYRDITVDFRADHLPPCTYLCVLFAYMDNTVLRESGRYAEVKDTAMYCGFQRNAAGEGYAILTVWDTQGRDKSGKPFSIRAKGVYPEDGSFEGNRDDLEGQFIHCLVPFDWQEGRNYRVLVQHTGRILDFWVKDLVTGAWTHLIGFDLGFDGNWLTSPVAFLEDFNTGVHHGEIRSMVLWNYRAWDHGNRRWLGTRKACFAENFELPGSYSYGSEGDAFWAITTAIPGRCRTPEQYLHCTVDHATDADPYIVP